VLAQFFLFLACVIHRHGISAVDKMW